MTDLHEQTRGAIHTVWAKGASHPRIQTHFPRACVAYIAISAIPIVVAGAVCIVSLLLTLDRLDTVAEADAFKDRARAVVRSTAIVGVLSALLIWRRAAQASLGERLWQHTEVIGRVFPNQELVRVEAIFTDALELKKTAEDTKTTIDRVSTNEVRLVRSQESERVELIVRQVGSAVRVDAIKSTDHWFRDPTHWQQIENLLRTNQEVRDRRDPAE